MRVRWLLLVFALLLGCKGDKDKKPAAAELLPVEGLAAIPARVNVVIAADLVKLGRAPLVRRAASEVLARDPELEKRVVDLMDSCGLELGKDVGGLVLAMGESRARSLLVARGRFQEAALAGCVGKSVTQSGGELTREERGGRNVYRAQGTRGQRPVFFALGSPRSLLVASSEEMLLESLGAEQRLADNRRLGELMTRADTSAALWAVGLVPEAVGKGMVGKAGVKKPPQGMVLRAHFETGLRVHLDVEMADSADAKSAVSLGKPQLQAASLVAQKAGLGALVNRIGIDSEGRWVRLAIDLSAAEVGEILARVQRTVDRSPAPQQNPPSDGTPASGDQE